MWILFRFQKCDFLDKMWIFAPVCCSGPGRIGTLIIKKPPTANEITQQKGIWREDPHQPKIARAKTPHPDKLIWTLEYEGKMEACPYGIDNDRVTISCPKSLKNEVQIPIENLLPPPQKTVIHAFWKDFF